MSWNFVQRYPETMKNEELRMKMKINYILIQNRPGILTGEPIVIRVYNFAVFFTFIFCWLYFSNPLLLNIQQI
jgi:hypothetical protein